MGSDPYIRRLVDAALAAHDSQQGPAKPRDGLIEPLTEAEQHVLRLLPTNSYLQIAATLYVSHNTVKTHVRAIYRKLGVSGRTDAIARAIELGLL
jgi:LuxR family maltose regulon positive regulatory protein